jgi:hypothetical protein
MRIIGRRAVAVVGSVALSMVGLLSGAGYAGADPPVFPSCAAFQSPGPDGVVHVQMSPGGNLTWGVTMTPLSKSVGAWHMWTMLGGRKTPSGFNRVLTAPYVPHGVIPAARSGLVFAARGWVDAADGEKYLVVGAPCRVP